MAMAQLALGMVETRGLTAAIEAADAGQFCRGYLQITLQEPHFH